MRSNEVSGDWAWKPDAAVRAAIARGDARCGKSRFGPKPRADSNGLVPLGDGNYITDMRPQITKDYEG